MNLHPLQSAPWHSLFTGAAAVRSRGASSWRWSTRSLPYESQLLHFDKQEHQSPQMLKINPRGRVPVFKDGDYVVFESVAMLYYLDVKYPADADIRRRTPRKPASSCASSANSWRMPSRRWSKIIEAIFAGPGRRGHRRAHRRHARRGARGAHHRRPPEQGAMDRRRRIIPPPTW